jgi:hypothetical protein
MQNSKIKFFMYLPYLTKGTLQNMINVNYTNIGSFFEKYSCLLSNVFIDILSINLLFKVWIS